MESTMNRFLFPSVMLTFLSLGCSAPPRLLADCPAGADAIDVPRVPVALELNTVASEQPFALGATERTRDGVEYKVTKLRYYLSGATLIDTHNATVVAPLAGPDGRKLPYGVALVDYAKPESLKLHVLAPPGEYKALNLTVGVPDSCATGEQLAHGDAAARVAPLDVDSDMYWSWNPSYVSFKIEGQVAVGGAWKPFFYHVGEDARRAKLHVHVPLKVGVEQSVKAAFVVDVNRLFVTPSGEDTPRLEPQRMHDGPLADQMAVNIAKSGFVTVAK
jgi:hypothetical protein